MRGLMLMYCRYMGRNLTRAPEDLLRWETDQSVFPMCFGMLSTWGDDVRRHGQTHSQVSGFGCRSLTHAPLDDDDFPYACQACHSLSSLFAHARSPSHSSLSIMYSPSLFSHLTPPVVCVPSCLQVSRHLMNMVYGRVTSSFLAFTNRS